jgi:hypothetical protein
MLIRSQGLDQPDLTAESCCLNLHLKRILWQLG